MFGTNKCSLEEHLLLCIKLMLFFYLLDYVSDVVLAFGLTTVKIGGATAHDAFLEFFGVAMGIFRGMIPASPAPGTTVTQTATVTKQEVKEINEQIEKPVS